jgi:hypothetical protein
VAEAQEQQGEEEEAVTLLSVQLSSLTRRHDDTHTPPQTTKQVTTVNTLFKRDIALEMLCFLVGSQNGVKTIRCGHQAAYGATSLSFEQNHLPPSCHSQPLSTQHPQDDA